MPNVTATGSLLHFQTLNMILRYELECRDIYPTIPSVQRSLAANGNFENHWNILADNTSSCTMDQ